MLNTKKITMAIFLFFSISAVIIADQVNDLKNLTSKNKKLQAEAKQSMITAGENTVKYFNKKIARITSIDTKRKIIDILKEIGGTDADKVLAKIALFDRSGKIRKIAFNYIQKEKPVACREYIIEKALSKSLSERSKAQKTIKLLDDPLYIDDLIKMMQYSIVTQSQSGGALQVDMVNRQFAGWSNYNNKYSYPTPAGQVSGASPVKMPKFNTTSIKTNVHIPIKKVLVKITGVDFDYDIAKWMIWRIKKYGVPESYKNNK